MATFIDIIVNDSILVRQASTTTFSVDNDGLITSTNRISLDDGLSNVRVGESAGTSITTGDSNTLIGDSAGNAITTSADNTLVGKFCRLRCDR